MFELLWPYFLILLPAPLLLRFLKAVNNKTALWWPDVELLRQSANTKAMAAKGLYQTLISLLLWLAWGLLLIALTRPVWLGEATSVTPSGRDLLIALDLSGSMQIGDMIVQQQPADRLKAAKHVLNDFITAREGDRIGLIVFGSKAYLQAPLSYDLNTIAQLVEETQIGFAGEHTAIGDAIGLGIKRLMDKDSEKRVMILMTDGANTAGRVKPDRAALFAKKQGVKVHTIGIGADEMVTQGFFGPKVVNPSSDLDEELLALIADSTGGKYFRAKNTEDLRRIYSILDELEPTPSEELWQRPQISLFSFFGIATLFSVFFAQALHWYGIRTGRLS
ncbi:VWA domain-containing protein [Marinomonas agarivorans]|nr:VWA domain-containing protein [Marinomonas agarivorans]